jgi:hypothetical protein
LERRNRVRTAPIRQRLITPDRRSIPGRPLSSDGDRALAARTVRPRKTDCDPSTDFNLCAFERECSIEAARLPDRVWASACPHLRAASSASGRGPSLARRLTLSSSRLCAATPCWRSAASKAEICS